MIPAFAAAIVAAFIYGAGSVLQAVGTRQAQTERTGRARFWSVVHQPLYLTGLGCDLIAWVLTVAALQHLPVFAVQSIVASSLAVTVVLAKVVFATTLRRSDIAAIIATAISLVLIGAAAGDHAPTPPAATFVVLIVVGAPALAAIRHATRSTSAHVSATIAGAAFAGSMLAARATHLDHGLIDAASRPLTWALVAYGLVGIVSYAGALETGNVGTATAITWATEIVLATTLGRIVLGDDARAGWEWIAAAGLALALASTVTLARSPTQTKRVVVAPTAHRAGRASGPPDDARQDRSG